MVVVMAAEAEETDVKGVVDLVRGAVRGRDGRADAGIGADG